MASIKERKAKDGSTYYQISVYVGKEASGKQIFKSRSFTPTATAPTKARKEVERFAMEFEQQVLSANVVDGDKITFSEFVEIWKKNWLSGKTPHTRENYMQIINNTVIPRIGTLKLSAIRPTHIDRIINERTQDGKKAATVRKDFTPVNSVFRYAVKKQYIRENPCDRRDDLPTVKAKGGNDIQFFTEDQANRFLNDALTMTYTYTCKAHKRTLKKTGRTYEVPEYTETHTLPLQWRIYYMMAIYGTFRKGELVAMTWEDLDMNNCIASVNKSMSRTKELGQFVKPPKTEASIRDLSMPEDCFVLLRRWKMEQMALCGKLGTAWLGHRNMKKADGTMDSFEKNTIFIQEDNGLPVDLSTPGHKFNEILTYYNAACREEDKLPRIRLHDLRHTGATLLLGWGVDIETVSRRLGHSKTSVTLDIYGHALPENDRKAADLMAEKLRRKSI